MSHRMHSPMSPASPVSPVSPDTPATPVTPDLPPSLAPPLPQEIASLLTIILTTSPTPSAPGTDLVATVLASFRAHCPALLACPVIVVFDTYDHIGPQLRLKKGCVTPVEAAHYETYKANVKALVKGTWSAGDAIEEVEEEEQGLAEYGSSFRVDNCSVPFTINRTAGGRVVFIEPKIRLGFGLGVRTALRTAATPYVWVQQHDWTLAADIPLASMLDAMRTSEQAMGDDDVVAKGFVDVELPIGPQLDAPTDPSADSPPTNSPPTVSPASSASSVSLFLDSSVPVPIRYICLPAVRMLRYASSAHAIGFPTLRALTAAFKREVPTSSSSSPSSTMSPDLCGSLSTAPGTGPGLGSGHRIPLTPLFFWHDKTHIASRAHYLRRVFPTRLAISRGDFIEDHIGQRARDQMKRDPAAWHRWACWLYYPEQGTQLCLRHLQGRTWRGQEQEQAMRSQYVKRNMSASSAAATKETGCEK
ncbi:hypothetical protein SEPCBS57363_004985 [Sporothrix epigloea]|uniref:Alcohol dehydrogenase n=1 Tax=Sporothrix epigloea TaxID=1892477 RepID=A0ABP0DV37_9PEZI